ncbi:MAG TPA: chemotaxis protein CheD [Acidobacteriaceae bacterium]|nr:chemotaxis protein CheD [Acidobacteriaceae bacterium]
MAHPEPPPEIYVQPGESRLVRTPAILRTVLGSCVGVAFWHQRLGIGALLHPMLPRAPGDARNRLGPAGARRYVDFTIREMADHLERLGAHRNETEVKLFGGADVLRGAGHGTRPTVGQLNRETALRVLREEGFGIAASCLGGTRGLHIQFHTATGEVLLRRLNETPPVRREPGVHDGYIKNSRSDRR